MNPALFVAATSLVVSLASAIAAWLAFYRVHLRGPNIVIRPPVFRAVSILNTQFNGAVPEVVLRVRLLVANQGPRPGVVEDIHYRDLVTVVDAEPSLELYQFSPPTELRDALGGHLHAPFVVRDGEVFFLRLDLRFGPRTMRGISALHAAKDLRRLRSAELRLSYEFSTARGLQHRETSVFVRADELLAETLSHWSGNPHLPELARALTIFSGQDTAADLAIEEG
jgi:hypothetical protein